MLPPTASVTGVIFYPCRRQLSMHSGSSPKGADLIDIGGESTRPQGAVRVSAEEERQRILPVIEAVHAQCPATPISVDTVKADVAAAALDAGAAIINDVSMLHEDPRVASVCAAHGAGLVLMHSRGDVPQWRRTSTQTTAPTWWTRSGANWNRRLPRPERPASTRHR